jgi:hypothetical protein
MKPAKRTNLIAPQFLACLQTCENSFNTVAFQRKIVPIRPVMPANRLQLTR